MLEAQALLKMIEAVDPSDTAMLDEIDMRAVWFFLKIRLGDSLTAKCDENWFKARARNEDTPPYSRSLDACADEMPEGWHLEHINCEGANQFVACFSKADLDVIVGNTLLPTEPLARLHAIIQAWAHERGKG